MTDLKSEMFKSKILYSISNTTLILIVKKPAVIYQCECNNITDGGQFSTFLLPVPPVLPYQFLKKKTPAVTTLCLWTECVCMLVYVWYRCMNHSTQWHICRIESGLMKHLWLFWITLLLAFHQPATLKLI